MFNPHYRSTPYLLQCLEKIAAHLALLKAAPAKTTLRLKIEREAVIQNVHSSTWIEGNTLSLEQVSNLSVNKDVNAPERQKREVSNALKALRWTMKNKTAALTEQKLLKLHALMTNGLLSPTRIGVYRNIPNFIVDGRNTVIYTPPAVQQVGKRMKDLFAWLNKKEIEHGIVRSAIFHHEFVAVHPFVDGNGRVARAASQWLLWEKGYDPVVTLGLDEFFALDRSRYYDMIKQTHEMDGDYTHWIGYVTEGVLQSVERTVKRFQHHKRLAKGVKIILTPKQEELIALLNDRGVLSSSEIGKVMNIQRARVNQLIAPLLKAGIVSKEGSTRAARYRLA